jgi:hypothetical protein
MAAKEIWILASSSKSVEAITLTGIVLDWNEELTEECAIAEAQKAQFERNGYMVVTIGRDLLAIRSEAPPDGTLTIQPKSDELGRVARSGGNANYGYSGYFRAYVYLGGQRKRLVNFWTLFPDRSHAYAAQQLKAAAEASIREKIASLAGTQVRKAKGGYAFNPFGGD